MPHLPGGRVSPEIGEHPGEPVIDLIQGQLPVGGFQDGLWTRKKYRDPQSGPARATGLCALPQLPSAWPLTHLRAEKTCCGSMWTRLGVPDGPERGRLVTAQPEAKGNTSLEGRALVRGARELLLQGKWLQGLLP